MKESLEIISCKGLEIILIIEVLCILVHSRMENQMVLEKKPGQMVQYMKDSLKMGKSMEKEFTNGYKDVLIMENG